MRYTAEILPYHDHPLEVAIRELAGLGFTEVNLGRRRRHARADQAAGARRRPPEPRDCLAPPHLWLVQDGISEAITWLAGRRKLFYYYIWDIDGTHRHGVDGQNFGPGEQQLPCVGGTLDHAVPLGTLARVGYRGPASLECHGTGGWSLHRITGELTTADACVRSCLPS